MKGIETASIQKPSGWGFRCRVIFLNRFVTRGGGFTNWTQPLRLGEEVKMAVKVKPNVWSHGGGDG